MRDQQNAEQGEIRKLPPEVVAIIAAGEVILRPLSVAKELLENALDAGAEMVEISVGDAPDQHLEISDDGCGMSRSGLELSVQPHATSKLGREDDLLRVRTLGFRGEALPSIGRVSRLEIITSDSADSQAWSLRVEGGRAFPPEPAARPRGTTVRVQDLFFNSPVRKRFLKTPEGEMRLITKMTATYALAYPAVGFRLTQRGGTVLDLPPAEDLAARIVQVHGASFRDKILAVESADGGSQISGYVGIPELARAGAQHQTLIVNQRWVSAPWFSAALRQGFGDLIPSNRNPFALIVLTLDPSRVDVNVHPTKREVRFLDESALFASVVRSVQAQTRNLVPGWNLNPRDPGSGRPVSGGMPGARTLDLFYGPSVGRVSEGVSDRTGQAGALPGESGGHDRAEGAEVRSGADQADRAAGERGVAGEGGAAGEPFSLQAGQDDTVPAGLIPLWQLHQKYIFAQTRNGFLILDQHAAHERVLYEHALRNLQGSQAATQQLLFPLPLEFDSEEWESWSKIAEDVINLGIDAEEFGRQTVLLRGVPVLWNHDPEGRFRELLDELGSRRTPNRDRLQHLAASFACRSAVRAGQALSLEEMNLLVDQLFATGLPHGDPHGRPTFLQVTLEDLDRRFGR